MKTRSVLITASSATLSILALLPPSAVADTGLIPVVASNSPNISTIVSSVNLPGGTSTHLTYIYRYKDAFNPPGSSIPNRNGNCSTRTLTRSTTDGDVVSFDVSGNLNGGSALFTDGNFYGGGFGLGVSGPQRGYLLITNSNSTGGRVDVGSNLDITGEFANADIASGAAWGGKMVNDATRENFDFINANIPGGGVFSALPVNGSAFRSFTFFPPSVWTTRFFVTPVGSAMDNANLTASVAMVSLFDRDGQAHPFAPISVGVTCTGTVDLRDLMDATNFAAVENVGGWAGLGVSVGNAAVYKLEFTADPIYGGTLNNGYLLSDFAIP